MRHVSTWVLGTLRNGHGGSPDQPSEVACGLPRSSVGRGNIVLLDEINAMEEGAAIALPDCPDCSVLWDKALSEARP